MSSSSSLSLPSPPRYSLPRDDEEENNANNISPYLAGRSYHLPGNDYWEDWVQYILNNHPLLGICCHDAQHPVGTKLRIVALIGSFVFGLAISCSIWLALVYLEHDPESVLLELHYAPGNSFVITTGMVILWTVGSGSHALFDELVWYSMACPCFSSNSGICSYETCHPCRAFGGFFVVLGVVFVTAIATFATLLRLTLEDDVDDQASLQQVNNFADARDIAHDAIQLHNIERGSLDFLFSYLIEVVLAYYYYPMLASLFFTGILGGCGKVPILGGRPYRINQLLLKQKKQQKRKQQKQKQKRKRNDNNDDHQPLRTSFSQTKDTTDHNNNTSNSAELA